MTGLQAGNDYMIGVFDSGLGGLTALSELALMLPDEDMIYFGDTGRVPYGTRSAETIIKYSVQDMNFLDSFGVDAVLVACGTVSSTALEELRRRFTTPIYGVIESAARVAVDTTINGKIAVIGTNATIKSGAFTREISRIDSGVSVITAACPLFVNLVENGFIKPGDEITSAAARQYLAPLAKFGVDTLILGCTHFPIISWAIEAAMPGVKLISSGKAAADAVAADVKLGKIKTKNSRGGSIRCFVSDKPDNFGSVASVFVDRDKIGRVERINIDKY